MTDLSRLPPRLVCSVLSLLATLAALAWPGAPARAEAGHLAQLKMPEARESGALPRPPSVTPAPYTPHPGQPGKDVVWVPTSRDLVNDMLDLAELGKDDYLVDLGSGDGRTVITAARRGARAHGIEYNPDLVGLARRNAEAEGVTDRASFEQGDIFESDFSTATVISLFLLPELNLRLRPILLEMRPGTRIVSNAFDMKDWEHDGGVGGSNATESRCSTWCRAYLWIVPAQVAGRWQLGEDRLEFTQTFQILEGTLTRGDQVLPIRDARMRGTAIAFTIGDRRYAGRLDGDSLVGQIEGGGAWTARRSGS